MLFKTFVLVLFSFSLLAEEISVGLSTQKKRPPICLYFLDQGDQEASYVKELYNTLLFDLNHTAHTTVQIINEKKDTPFWKSVGVTFVAQVTLRKEILELNLQNIKTKRFYSYTISLEKDLILDRQKIHKMASQITYDLFGVKGIQDKKMLYSLRTKDIDWISEIWICDYDGKNAKQLTKAKTYAICPRFIPNEKGFVYINDCMGQPKIIKATFDNTRGTILISLRGSQALPALSLNGRSISFISDAAGRPDLFYQSLDSDTNPLNEPMQLFSFPRATQATPTFSPDGKKIAFVSDKDGPPRIYVLDIPTTRTFKTPKSTLITKKNRQNTSPCWSSDGTKLAYSAKTDGIRQIWIYDFEQDEEWQLTTGDKNMENPMWAPDSLHLVFNSEDDFISEMFLMNIYEQKPIKISSGPGDKRFPAWEF